jgi:hypothetical protein
MLTNSRPHAPLLIDQRRPPALLSTLTPRKTVAAPGFMADRMCHALACEM